MNAETTEIPWREWSDDVFAEARAQDKLILLDIGAVWCHWCHVMDEGIPGDPIHTGTYTDPDVQKRIAADFISIKVDTDRRPDINARYNMGGWPTTAFLNAEGEMLYGETYVPPDRMAALMDRIVDYFRNHKTELAEQTASLRAQRAESEAETPAAAIDPHTAAVVTEAIRRNFDFAFGGFGTQPKFPHPDALLLTLEQYAATGDPELRQIAKKTLDAMANGGMYDRFAGGFFRYSTTRDWSIPHFEKMLEDNAKLTAVYALASVVLNEPRYLETVKSADEWLFSVMRDSQAGTFAGSQDADGEERYYGQPLAVRATMPTPYIDRTVYAGWNAQMVSSLVKRYQRTREADILAAARQAFDFVRTQLGRPEGDALVLRHFYADGAAQGASGLLADQTAFVAAALDLYETTSEPEYLAVAALAANAIIERLQDTQNGGFYDLPADPDAVGELARPKKEIGDNADAALALLRLAALTDDAEQIDFREAAERALRLFAGDYARYSFFAASYARAVLAALHTPLHIVIAGETSDARTLALQDAAWRVVSPGKVVETLPPAAAKTRRFPTDQSGAPRAYVCVGMTCLAPVTTPAELTSRIAEAQDM